MASYSFYNGTGTNYYGESTNYYGESTNYYEIPYPNGTGSFKYPVLINSNLATWTSLSSDSITYCPLVKMCGNYSITWDNYPITYAYNITWSNSTPWNVVTYDHREELKKLIRKRSLNVFKSRSLLERRSDEREMAAREVLRKIIGEDKYRKFLSYGFVSVKGRSDKTYLIYPGHGLTRVFENGVEEKQLCVVFGDFPPTDSLITRYLMILNDEKEFDQIANKQNIYKETIKQYNNISLVEAAKSLRRTG